MPQVLLDILELDYPGTQEITEVAKVGILDFPLFRICEFHLSYEG